MNPSRRDFLKITAVGGAAAAVFGFDLKPGPTMSDVLDGKRDGSPIWSTW